MPIHAQLSRHATERPDKPALVIDDRVLTYGELYSRAKAIYGFLQALPYSKCRTLELPGVEKLAALSLGNHIGFAEYFVAATALPNACAVIDPMMPPERVERIIERLAPDVLVVDDIGPSAEIGRRLGISVITAGAEPFDLAETEGELPSEAEGIFLIGFTSGTTAEPKAYYRSREQWRRSLDRGRLVFELKDAPSTLCPGALAHGLALYALVEALDAGGTFHSVRKWHAEAVARTLSAEKIERLVAVPTHVAGIARAWAAKPALTSLRDILTAGAKLDVNGVESMRRLFPGARIREYYGASEIGFMTVSTLVGGAAGFPIDRVGQAYPGVEISIRDPDEKDVGTDVPGTIFVRSDLIADGYLWGDDGQAFRVTEAGATVGDLGELDDNGMLRVIGRAGGMMISGGNNVYPAEVESALKACPGVEDAVVFGLPDAYYGQRIVAVVSGETMDAKILADHCADRLVRYKFPRQFYHIGSWPMTTSGKIARGQVEAAVISGDGLVLRLSA